MDRILKQERDNVISARALEEGGVVHRLDRPAGEVD